MTKPSRHRGTEGYTNEQLRQHYEIIESMDKALLEYAYDDLREAEKELAKAQTAAGVFAFTTFVLFWWIVVFA